jgi:hypothetical protein
MIDLSSSGFGADARFDARRPPLRAFVDLVPFVPFVDFVALGVFFSAFAGLPADFLMDRFRFATGY